MRKILWVTLLLSLVLMISALGVGLFQYQNSNEPQAEKLSSGDDLPVSVAENSIENGLSDNQSGDTANPICHG